MFCAFNLCSSRAWGTNSAAGKKQTSKIQYHTEIVEDSRLLSILPESPGRNQAVLAQVAQVRSREPMNQRSIE